MGYSQVVVPTFEKHLEADGFFAIRMFVLRNDDGEIEADCRVNGVDWDVGAEALVRYASTWPELGFEFRKQYVVIHSAGE